VLLVSFHPGEKRCDETIVSKKLDATRVIDGTF